MVNGRDYLNRYYPRRTRGEMKILNIYGENIEGKLNLSNFTNLQELYCQENKIDNLDVSKCSKLTKLNCSNNFLKKLDLSNCPELLILDASYNDFTKFNFNIPNIEKLIHLNLMDNNLSLMDLSCFSNFINLEILEIGNDNLNMVEENDYNRFRGSLKNS